MALGSLRAPPSEPVSSVRDVPRAQRPLVDVPLLELPLERFDSVLGPRPGAERLHRYLAAATPSARRPDVWNVNSTARGGGVAEMLRSLLAYARGAGVDVRWLVDRR